MRTSKIYTGGHKPLKIYIGASYPRIKEAEALGEKLDTKGFIVLSLWHQESKSTKDSDYFSGLRALRDKEGVKYCDIFIEFIGDEKSHGGRHCELGMALAWGKRIMLIGDKDKCIFTNLPWLARYKNANELLKRLI